jgi:hypothetical protein
MRLFVSLALYLALAQPAYSGEVKSAEVVAVGKRLDFIADISRFQGMFDSVVEFCRPHAPEHLLKFSRDYWLVANQRFLDLRDKELNRVIEEARGNGAKPEKITLIKDWAKQQYQEALSNNRMFKDLFGAKDLDIACSRRLGEMNSTGMSLGSIRPSAAEYAKTAGKP